MPTTLKDFESVFPRLVEDLTEHCKKYNLPENALQWYTKVCTCSFCISSFETNLTLYIKSLFHNTMGGKCNRGLSVPDTVSILKSTPIPSSHPLFFPSATLGWMIELLQAFFLVSDDIMDSSHTRRGQPCWYRIPQVGMIAINDSFMLESSIFILLKKHFRSHPQYLEMIELFQETTFQTELGQTCDLLTAPEDDVDLGRFSMEKYIFIVRYKTAFYSFYLPVALALHFCEIATEKNLKQASDILIPMGEYFQVQDDYLDVYADPETLGKIGTDIQDNKCSWIVNQALKRVSPEQRKVLDDNYGRKDKDCEAKCKQVFADLDMEKEYKEYEEKVVGEIKKMIEQVDESDGLKKEVFEEFLRKIYKRTK